jgi:3-deoxy-manno-octulosonate cytidylyltransferase (CMP-KDO synthetase)
MGKVVAVIPARYGSTRFPAKMMALLKGKPLLQWVWEGVRGARTIGSVLIATDDDRIRVLAEGFGAEVRMTSPDHPSGTDRVAEAVAGIDADWVVNVQGDEPMISGSALDEFVSGLGAGFGMATVARRMEVPGEEANPNQVKVVFAADGRALYFSRSPIPYRREPGERVDYWHHLGLYAYRPEVLKRLVALPPSSLEQAEKLEQLRALQNGIAIQVIPTSLFTVGVDTPEDLARVEALLTP